MSDPLLSAEAECVGVAYVVVPPANPMLDTPGYQGERVLMAAFELVESPIDTTIELPIEAIGPDGVTVGARYLIQLMPVLEET